jgi:hypothetical protein
VRYATIEKSGIPSAYTSTSGSPDMFSVDISYDQPWFDHVRLLRSREEKALRSYFKALEADVSQLVLEDPDIYETELTTGLVRSLKGVDSVAKRELDRVIIYLTHIAGANRATFQLV